MSKKIEQKLIKDIQQLSNISINNNDKQVHQLATSIQTAFSSYIEKPKKQKYERKANETGLGKARDIYPRLAEFLKCDHSETKSRNDVTKIICDYIKEHNLQDPEAKKYFICDKPLMNLLDLDESDKRIAYTELQSELGGVFMDDSTTPIYKGSEELLKFTKDHKLGKVPLGKDTLVSFFQIKKMITKYIKINNLKNKRKITLDDSLKQLFKVESDDITQVQFERYIKDTLVQVKDRQDRQDNHQNGQS